MTSFSDLPPFALDQIIGTRDTSYVVIKLWLCGDFKLHNKLSTGLTFLELKNHPYGAFTVPKVISHLQSLRHLSLHSRKELFNVYDTALCREAIRSWPSSLESLSIQSADTWKSCLFQSETSRYTRGTSRAIEFETLFPRLRSLTFGAVGFTLSLDSSFFAALPASLTELDVPIDVKAPFDTFLSLPPTIRLLKGRLQWSEGIKSYDRWSTDAILRLCDCLVGAPSTLEYMDLTLRNEILANRCKEPSSDLCNSLLKVKYSSPWRPSIARTMPPNLHTLTIESLDVESYRSTFTNWVSDLPRSLTKLSIKNFQVIDLASRISSLPPKLTDLTLSPKCEDPDNYYNPPPLGDWNTVSSPEFWPSTLTRLYFNPKGLCWLEPSQIVNLPQSVTVLALSVSTYSYGVAKPTLDTKLLPPRLTDLSLTWTSQVSISLSLEHLELINCTLEYDSTDLFDLRSTFKSFPNSLEHLILENIAIQTTETDELDPETLLPNLKALTVSQADCDWFPNIPRKLEYLDIRSLLAIAKSPLLQSGQLFKHLPTSLVSLKLSGHARIHLPPQDLPFPSLRTLTLLCTQTASSEQIRKLPPTLKELSIYITDLDGKDISLLPQHLERCKLGEILDFVDLLPFRSLSTIKNNFQGLLKLVQNRVRKAALHQ